MQGEQMADVMTTEQRSRCMSRIKGRDTKPELQLRKALWAKGLRYRTNYKLPGRPDIAFVGARVAVFVDGCFCMVALSTVQNQNRTPTFGRKSLLRTGSETRGST